jgi:hypothetical protein
MSPYMLRTITHVCHPICYSAFDIKADPQLLDFTGTVLETGAGEGLNYNVNIPLPRAITDDERYLSALDIAIERVLSFTPEYLVIRYASLSGRVRETKSLTCAALEWILMRRIL